MTRILFPLLSLAGALVFGSHATASKTKKAHEHGSAKLDILSEGKTVTVSLESPAESIVGFEHEAKSDKDKVKQAEALDKLKGRFAEIVVFDAALGCKFMDAKVEVIREDEGKSGTKSRVKEHGHEAEHSEVRATFKAECEKPVAGTSARVDFDTHFPGVRKLAVQVLSGEKQKGYNLRKKGRVEL